MFNLISEALSDFVLSAKMLHFPCQYRPFWLNLLFKNLPEEVPQIFIVGWYAPVGSVAMHHFLNTCMHEILLHGCITDCIMYSL